MKVYVALFCLNKNNDCFEPISIHETQKGVEKAISDHQEFVYGSADVFFPSGQTNLCVWTWKEMEVRK